MIGQEGLVAKLLRVEEVVDELHIVEGKGIRSCVTLILGDDGLKPALDCLYQADTTEVST